MRARFLADGDFSVPTVRGLRRVQAGIDFLPAQGFIPEGLLDPEVLALAANVGRVLVSHDLRTMAGHFYRFVRQREFSRIGVD